MKTHPALASGSLCKLSAVALLASASLIPLIPSQAVEADSTATSVTVDQTRDVRVSETEANPESVVSSAAAAVGVPSTGEAFNCEVTPFDARSGYRVWNPRAGLYQDGTIRVGSSDILMLGDSQVWSQSWVAKGVRQAGYNPVMYRCGGIGVTAWRPNYSGSYHGGVTKNEFDLPVGKPRAIYIQGSGNDSYTVATRDETVRRLPEMVTKLRQLYPDTQIILTGPLGSDVSWQTHRWDLDARLANSARSLGLTYISYERWVTDYGLRGSLADDVHFKDAEQWRLAAPMAESLKAALRGNTLKGGIESYVSDNGGSARVGVPLNNETPSAGGVYQTFSANNALYWSNSIGTYRVWFGGAIGQKFAHSDYERGLGFPLEDETGFSYGARQTFQKPDGRQSRVYWSSNTGAHIMNGRGAVFHRWVGLGHASKIGFPTTDEIGVGYGGVVQYFRDQRGAERAIYWSPNTGAHVMNAKGAIYYQYVRNGYTTKYGYPTTDEYTDSRGITHVKFSNGYDIQWTARGGVKVVRI